MPQPRNPYAPHRGIAMMQTWMDTLPETTGKSLEEWIRLVKAKGPATTADRRTWLKQKHKLGTNVAACIVERAEGRGQAESDPAEYLRVAVEYVDAMFSGARATLRPIYDAILAFGLSLGKDVKVSPGKTIVPFYRNHVFAQVKPTTQTRVDLGFCLKGIKPAGRLVTTGGEEKGDRITHRIPLSSVGGFDREARTWMTRAYEADG